MDQEPTAYRVPDPGIRDLFSEQARIQSWLDVEAALAAAQADLGIIPQAAAEEIGLKARFENLNLDNIHEGLARTGHPIVPTVWELDRICEHGAGDWVHWGATTQNIIQTARLLMVRKAHGIFLHQLGAILARLADLAALTGSMIMPARTHGQHAVPATFGYKVSVWIDELCRHVERLRGCEPRVFVAMLGGAAGTMASLGPIGLEVQDRLADRLGLGSMSNPARTIADHIAEYVVLLGMLAATSSKIGREIYTLMKQEFGEVEEPVPEGTVGSSTMPQKRNPKLTQDIVAGAAELRALVPLALEAMQTEHEADRTTYIMIDRALTQSCILTGDVLERLLIVLRGLRLVPDRMRQNLELTGGLIMSEAIMLELGKTIGRQKAHDAVYDAAQASFVERRPFTETLREQPEVRSNLTQDQIKALLDPERYLGACSLLAERGAKNARIVARSLGVS